MWLTVFSTLAGDLYQSMEMPVVKKLHTRGHTEGWNSVLTKGALLCSPVLIHEYIFCFKSQSLGGKHNNNNTTFHIYVVITSVLHLTHLFLKTTL